jgi:small subunit ribosomal protein S2
MSTATADIKTLFDAGAHVGYSRTRRHPTSAPFLFATKDRTDIFNLEETAARITKASEFAASLAQNGKQICFVGGKNEVQDIVKVAAERAGLPYVAGRWIGGTLTNFKNIRKRIDRLEKLMAEREAGELAKYTKKERLMIDREIDELLNRFGGIVTMKELPAALFVVDTRHEKTAVQEANQLKIPVIGLSSSDGDFSLSQYPIPANDTSVKAVRLIVGEMADAYMKGKKVAK